jgi:hypothetical protein
MKPIKRHETRRILIDNWNVVLKHSEDIKVAALPAFKCRSVGMSPRH